MGTVVIGGIVFRLSIFFFRKIHQSGNRPGKSRRHVDSGRSITRVTKLSAGSGAIGKYRFRTGTRNGKTHRVAIGERHGQDGRRIRLAGVLDSVAADKRILSTRRKNRGLHRDSTDYAE